MAIGIVSEDEFERELERLKVPKREPASEVIGEVISPKPLGRGEGTENIPETVRKFIAEEALLGTPKKQIIDTFGICSSSINAYQNNKTSTATDKISEPLKKHTDKIKERIKRGAQSKITMALANMTPDKFASAELPVLARVTESMASVIEKMTDREVNNGPQVQFVMYAPRIEREEHYDVINVEA